MRLLPVLIGLLLLIIGLGVYYGVPNIHNMNTTLSRDLTGTQQLIVEGGAQRVLNITMQQDTIGSMKLETNVTVRTSSGLSQLRFRVSSMSNADSCFPAVSASNCLYNDLVSNSTVEVPLTAPSPLLYLIFDNTYWTEEKVVSYSVALKRDLTNQSLTYDAVPNWLGLSLAALGSISMVYGLARKTVIPWE